jgi:hypothetical protein
MQQAETTRAGVRLTILSLDASALVLSHGMLW